MPDRYGQASWPRPSFANLPAAATGRICWGGLFLVARVVRRAPGGRALSGRGRRRPKLRVFATTWSWAWPCALRPRGRRAGGALPGGGEGTTTPLSSPARTPAGRPQVVLTADYATMAGIASGRISALDAMSSGRARITGNTAALSAHQAVLEALDLVPPSGPGEHELLSGTVWHALRPPDRVGTSAPTTPAPCATGTGHRGRGARGPVRRGPRGLTSSRSTTATSTAPSKGRSTRSQMREHAFSGAREWSLRGLARRSDQAPAGAARGRGRALLVLRGGNPHPSWGRPAGLFSSSPPWS